MISAWKLNRVDTLAIYLSKELKCRVEWSCADFLIAPC